MGFQVIVSIISGNFRQLNLFLGSKGNFLVFLNYRPMISLLFIELNWRIKYYSGYLSPNFARH